MILRRTLKVRNCSWNHCLAKRIGVAVVCEGVEVQEQVKILKEMRCDLIQGYVYAKPMPRSEFEDKIQRDDFL